MTLVYDLDHDFGLPLGELKNRIGGKAAGINVMATQLRLRVPPGFVVTTDTCNAYLAGGWPAGLEAELREHMARTEAIVGRRFGDPNDPLLVSVRSGAPISMPGMMDTILNLGLNESTTAGLARASSDPAFAANCHERFREMYLRIVGTEAPEDPWLQLRGAVEAVFRSWNGERARTYRRHEKISDELGTAVTVQTMVFGNRGADSATGVLFTRDSVMGEHVLSGNVLFNAQGEDVVAGTHTTEPVSVLDTRLPEVGRELREVADRLERHYADMCDIEFTIEQGKLWLLQVRVGKRSALAALRIAVDMASDPSFPLTREEAVKRVSRQLEHPPLISRDRAGRPEPLATGIAASPGVAHGEIVTSPDAAVTAAGGGRKVILVREATSPGDVHGIEVSAGLLTSRGDAVCHGALVAREWGIPAVVGASAIGIGDAWIEANGRRLPCGEVITIDGSTGEVFVGEVAGSTEVAPEAATLLAWAKELGIPIGAGETPVAAEAEAATAPAELCSDDVIRSLAIKGLVTPEALATTLADGADKLAPMLDGLVTIGFAEKAAGAFRLTGEGKLKAIDIFSAERDRAGGGPVCVEALDGFRVLDLRVKDIVTAWQLGPSGDPQSYNDHSDAPFDASILERLAALHADVLEWLAPLEKRLPRMSVYVSRLGAAVAAARGRDVRFVSSPRVDSYHSVWFELHEDMIRLAGRRRSDEVSAGRA